MDILPWFIIAITIPWVLWGFFTFQGLKFEDYFHSWISFNLLPQKRVYEDTDESLFQGLHEELLAEKIIKQRIDNGEEINQEG
ncbi:PrgI family protein [Ruminococcus sp. XPD3002]|nr:PrgI family protein [Ruminococcus flavefaciens]